MHPRFMRARLPLSLGALGALLLAPIPAAAQGHGGVASSGMGQGEARISSRSDVRLSMESMPGTSGAAVSALGTRVGAQMATIRGCYEATVAENPTITGTLRMRVLLEGRGRPNVEVDRDGVGNPGLVRCVTTALGRIDSNGLQRPTRAVVQLEMANSAARGAERAQQVAQQASRVPVTVDGDGNPSSTGGTPDGHVRFTVTGRGRDAAGAVVAGHRALLTALPGLMDCRRRSGRRGRSPAGELAVTMQVRDGRTPQSRVTRSTVPNERARTCVSRALSAIEERSTGGSGHVQVSIRFAEAEVIENAQ